MELGILPSVQDVVAESEQHVPMTAISCMRPWNFGPCPNGNNELDL